MTGASHSSVTMLLWKVGGDANRSFSQRLAALGIDVRHANVLQAVSKSEGDSQQAVSEALGVPPSRMVALVDDLEALGAVERRRNPSDRRTRALYLTADGRRLLVQVQEEARAHDASVCQPLSSRERAALVDLLRRLDEDPD